MKNTLLNEIGNLEASAQNAPPPHKQSLLDSIKKLRDWVTDYDWETNKHVPKSLNPSMSSLANTANLEFTGLATGFGANPGHPTKETEAKPASTDIGVKVIDPLRFDDTIKK